PPRHSIRQWQATSDRAFACDRRRRRSELMGLGGLAALRVWFVRSQADCGASSQSPDAREFRTPRTEAVSRRPSTAPATIDQANARLWNVGGKIPRRGRRDALE